MNDRERRLSLILTLCVGVLLIAFFALVIYPQYTKMSKKADEATTAKNVAQAKLKHAIALKKNEKSIYAQLANLKARIPSSLELSNVINQIDEKAGDEHLVWLQGTPEDVTSLATSAPAVGQTNTLAPQLDRHDFTIVVDGAMPDFIKFMSDLTDESIGRIIVLNSLDLQFKTDQGPDAIEATLKLQVVGWKEGGKIDSNGCIEGGTESTTAPDSLDNPSCNRSTLTTPTS